LAAAAAANQTALVIQEEAAGDQVQIHQQFRQRGLLGKAVLAEPHLVLDTLIFPVLVVVVLAVLDLL